MIVSESGMKMLSVYLERVRSASPLVHCITNYVTVNDCANILLACGGSPIMADDQREAAEITALCAGLDINIGTLNERTIPSMFDAGKRANQLGHPVLLDPVGAGASALRTDTARSLLEAVRFGVIRGNASEIKTLAGNGGATKGVDADAADAVQEKTLDDTVAMARALSQRTGAVVVITGAVDLVSDADKTYLVRNGHPMMARITGSGCMLSAMTTAYLAVNPDHPLEAAAAAVCAMGLCGELAAERTLAQGGGNASMRTHLIDAVCNLDGQTLDKGAKLERYEGIQ